MRNPVTLDRVVNAALDAVTVDDLLTADDLIDLARAFRARRLSGTLRAVGRPARRVTH